MLGVFLIKENSILIKFMEPTIKTLPAYRASGKGGGLYHLGFSCKDINGKNIDLKD